MPIARAKARANRGKQLGIYRARHRRAVGFEPAYWGVIGGKGHNHAAGAKILMQPAVMPVPNLSVIFKARMLVAAVLVGIAVGRGH